MWGLRPILRSVRIEDVNSMNGSAAIRSRSAVALLKAHGLSSEVFDRLGGRGQKEIDDAVSFARQSPVPDE